jgi:hypothetical protein
VIETCRRGLAIIRSRGHTGQTSLEMATAAAREAGAIGVSKGGQPGNQNASNDKNDVDNVNIVSRPTGNSQSYTLRRLLRDRPDLFEPHVAIRLRSVTQRR